ncbi:MAG: TraR/DksA C4-type zinc finger protein [Planctomycetota bacterium]
MLTRSLTCGACGWRTVERAEALASRLRLVGLLRRDTDPDDAIVAALLEEAAGRMTCPGCKSIGLTPGDADAVEDDEDDWQAARLCEVCRQPIPPERVEALPGVKRCFACQSRAESGADAAEDEPDFCPRCGALVELRVSRAGGLTRYRRFCTAGCRL